MEDFLKFDVIEEVLQYKIGYNMKKILEKRKHTKVSKKDFVNSLMALEVVKVSEAHIKYVTFLLNKSKIFPNKDIPLRTFKCAKNRENMQNLLMLFGLV